MVVTLGTVTYGRVAPQTIVVADAIVLLAVVLLTITAFPNCTVQAPLLLQSSLNSRFSIVVLAVLTLANAWNALLSSLEAHTVQLATFASLTVTAAGFCVEFRVHFPKPQANNRLLQRLLQSFRVLNLPRIYRFRHALFSLLWLTDSCALHILVRGSSLRLGVFLLHLHGMLGMRYKAKVLPLVRRIGLIWPDCSIIVTIGI